MLYKYIYLNLGYVILIYILNILYYPNIIEYNVYLNIVIMVVIFICNVHLYGELIIIFNTYYEYY